MGNISKVIVYERVREVYQFMISGSKQTKDIILFFSEKWTKDGVFEKSTSEISKQRTIHNYISRVKKSFFNFENDCEIEKGRTLARLDDLYSKSIKIQDYKGALLVLKEISDIVGFKAPSKLKHEGEITIPTIIVQSQQAAENLKKLSE